MKKKAERIADLGLKQIGVTPLLYHFESHVEPFTAITIAEDLFSRISIRALLDDIITKILPSLQHEKATRLRIELAQQGIYGVSICDSRDSLNRQRGRTIAKGRLLKHLKRIKGEVGERRKKIEKEEFESLQTKRYVKHIVSEKRRRNKGKNGK